MNYVVIHQYQASKDWAETPAGGLRIWDGLRNWPCLNTISKKNHTKHLEHNIENFLWSTHTHTNTCVWNICSMWNIWWMATTNSWREDTVSLPITDNALRGISYKSNTSSWWSRWAGSKGQWMLMQQKFNSNQIPATEVKMLRPIPFNKLYG